MASRTPSTSISPKTTFLSLATEIRLEILSYVLTQDADTGFHLLDPSLHPFTVPGLQLSPTYSASTSLSLRLVCRQFARDSTQLAFRNTHFPIRDTFTPVPQQLSVLSPLQISALRNISFVVAETQLRELTAWTRYPFNVSNLHLEVLNIVFLRSGCVLYPHDFTPKLVALLRRLENVSTLRFVRNGANVKGSFKPWYHRLIGLHLKEDHHQRYDLPSSPRLPKNWWDWSFSDSEQSFSLTATEPAGIMEESEYLEMMKPHLEELMRDIVSEEMDPDPRARTGW